MVVFPPGTEGFLNPQNIVEGWVFLEPGMVIADFGCGHGYFSLPLAQKVGEEGKVFALDILPSALEAVNSQARLNGISNIKTMRCDLEKEKGSGLEDESCDVVLIANLLFQVDDEKAVIKEAKRVLKKGGKATAIDWQANTPFGPLAKRVSSAKAKRLFLDMGFVFERDFVTDNYHYGMIFRK